MSNDIGVRASEDGNLERVNRAYAAFGYPTGAELDDTVILTERGDEIVERVRATLEHGVTMLRACTSLQKRSGSVSAAHSSAPSSRGWASTTVTASPTRTSSASTGSKGFYVLEPEHAPAFLAKPWRTTGAMKATCSSFIALKIPGTRTKLLMASEQRLGRAMIALWNSVIFACSSPNQA